MKTNAFIQKSCFLPLIFTFLFLFIFEKSQAQEGISWLRFEGKSGPGKGKHIVLVSGDDEYRSEEALPMMAKILSQHHGFTCTVLFAIEPETGHIKPDYQNNIPGLEHLRNADLMILFTRFRELPDEQTKYFEEYLLTGKPIIGIRTATHGFHYTKNKNSPYAKYHWQNPEGPWKGGFGQKIFGETWVAHHGEHGKEGARGLPDGVQQLNDHPILRGVRDIWVPSDVYSIKNLPAEAEVLIHGQSTQGMTAAAPLMWEKSVMPVAWTKNYQVEGGKAGKAFVSTMGASIDLVSKDLRRMYVNAVYWSLGMGDQVKPDLNVEIVGSYEPSMFGFGTYRKGMKVGDFR
jgi:hypothetical protein